MAATRRFAARRLVRGALLALLVVIVGLGVTAVLSGRYQIRPVLTGSMRPGLPVGGIVITERVPVSSLRVRDVVVFHRPDAPQDLVVHRIVALRNGTDGVIIQTQGDANNARDPWTVTLRGTTAYRAVWSLPLVGYIAVWMHNPTGRRTLLAIGLLLVFYVFAASVTQRRRAGKRAAADTADSELEGASADDNAVGDGDAVADDAAPQGAAPPVTV